MSSAPALLLGSAAAAAIPSGATTAAASTGAVTNVVVHTVALLHILDHHSRRQEDSGRVIGTLLGRRLDSNTIEVTNCFAVPHAERGDEVAIGKDFNKKMLNLQMRINRKEVVVGWYASAASDNDAALVTDTSSLIHEFYAGESDEDEPVHLVVDTRLSTLSPTAASINVRAYKSMPVVVQGEHLGNMFHELRLTLQSSEPEAICLHEMIKSEGLALKNGASENEEKKDDTVAGDALQTSMEQLHELLTSTLEYVDSVVDGKTPADAEVGRQIADTLATVPRVRPEIFENLFHNSLQDLLMVTYLANITRTQITIAEKLNASLGV